MAIVEEVRFDGVQIATQQLGALAHVLIDAQNATTQVRTAADAAGREARNLAAAHSEAERSARDLGQQFTQIPARIAGVANAISSLVQRLGGGAFGATVGLVGSFASTIAQGAQMGMMFGPGGAMVGAIGGAAVEAFTALAAAVDGATRAETDFEAASQRAATGAAALMQQVNHQLEIRNAVQRADAGTLNGERAQQLLIEQRNLVRELDDANQAYLDSAHSGLGMLTESEADRAAHQHAYEQQRIEALNSIRTLEEAVGVAAQHAADENERTLTGLHHQIDVVNHHAEEQAAARRRSASGRAASDLAQAASAARQRASEAEQTAAQQYATILAEQNKLLNEQQIAEEQAADAADRRRHTNDTAEQRAATARTRYHEQLAHYQEQERRWAQETDRTRQAQTQDAQSAATAIIGNLTNVFTMLAQGQVNAAQAGELMLAGFLQYVSQMAAVNALRSVADAVMAASEERWGAFASGLAAAGLWGAVAVAAGAGGAALAADAQSKGAGAASQAQSAPASPKSSSDSNGKGGSVTYVTNFNSPVVTASTEAQLGRTIRRLSDRAEQRYPGG